MGPIAWAVAAGLLLEIAVRLIPQQAGLVLMGSLLTAISGFAVLGYLGRATREQGRIRVGWGFGSLTALMWAATNVLYTVQAFRRVVPHDPSQVQPSDLTATVAILSAMVMFVLLCPAAGSAQIRLRRFIDGATIAGALAFVGWYFLISPIYELVAEERRLPTLVVSGAEIAMTAFAIVALSRTRRQGGQALTLLALTLSVFSVVTQIDILNTVSFDTRYEHGVAGGYVAATVLLALCTHTPLPTPTTGAQDRGDGLWPHLPYVPVLLCFAAAGYLQVRDGRLGAVSVWVLLFTALLVLVRQSLNLRSTQELLRNLDEQAVLLAHLAYHDPLTGLGNRSLLSDRAAATAETADEDTVTAVIILDLDGFKAVNDSLGHAAGDELLTIVAARLKAAVRGVDLVIRMGGDEFVVFMPGLPDPEDAVRLGARILRAIGEPFSVAGTTVLISGSIGVAVAHGLPPAPDLLLRDADLALYQAKAAGKNQLRLFRPPPQVETPPVEAPGFIDAPRFPA